ncbi:hypothetical protein RJ639_034870 [Escallonia herrerae]|uniref:Pentatricopeptide repeat-containing protein n=1 Tax=Escallonia herrerae TaxID=1293975 RepID=A0AA88WQA0_9ASTE|nr:hypothetical protein RJ639_034870 [Escallonia herrerae]
MIHSLSSVSPLHKFPPSEETQDPTSQTLRTHLLSTFNTPFELKQLHTHIIKTNSALPLPRVAAVCAFTPSFLYAQEIFARGGQPQIVIWNTCLKSFAESESPIDAIHLFYRLRVFDVCPDAFTFSFALKACLQLMDMLHGRIVHGFIEKLGYQANVFLGNAMVHLYGSCGEMDDARKLFEKMPDRDVLLHITFSTASQVSQ